MEFNETRGAAGLLADFEWDAYPSGFDVVMASPEFFPDAGGAHDASKPRDYLVPRNAHETPVAIKPFGSKSDLLAEFTKCRSKDRIKRFANKFGPLWKSLPGRADEYERMHDPFVLDRAVSGSFALVNDVDLIIEHAYRMHDVMEMRRKPGQFKKKKRGAGVLLEFAVPHHSVPYSIPVRPPFDKDPETYVVAYLVERELNRLGAIDLRVTPQQDRTISTTLRPPSLLAALWVRLAFDLAKPSNVLICDQCKEPFLSTAKPRGKPRRFCSPACKTANQRQR